MRCGVATLFLLLVVAPAPASVFTDWDNNGSAGFVYARFTIKAANGAPLLETSADSQLQAIPVLSGSVKLDLVWINNYVTPVASPAAGSVTIEYGLDGQQTLSGYIQGPPFTFTLDTTHIPDGTHVLTVRIVDSTGATWPASQIRSVNQEVVIQNSGPLNGAQRMPVPGFAFESLKLPPAVDWVTYPGSPQHNTIHPYPYPVIPPTTSAAQRSPSNWFIESLTETRASLYEGNPQFYTTRSGGVVTQYYYAQANSQMEASVPAVQHHANMDGGRDDNMLDPYSNVVPAPDGSGWVGVDLAGRIFKVNHDGSVVTLAGLRPSRNVLQYDYKDLNVSNAQIAAKAQQVGAGMSPGNYGSPNDLVFDPRNSNLLYVTDTIHHAIWKVDLSQVNPSYQLYAGEPDQSGYVNGPAAGAQFNEPYSLIMAPDGTMYVADFNNCAIRKISPDGSTVSTLVGLQPGQSAPSIIQVGTNRDAYSSPTPVAFASAQTPYPHVIRFDSSGNIVEGEPISDVVRLINLANRTVSRIYTYGPGETSSPTWIWLDVDTVGTIGPKDDILMARAQGNGNTDIFRFSEDGSYGISPQVDYSDGGGVVPDGRWTGGYVTDASGHYPWFIAISKTEARFVTMGFGSTGMVSWRALQPSDPPSSVSLNNFGYGGITAGGFHLWRTGTVAGFPWGSRPSFAALHGVTGNGHLGVCPTFDDLIVQYPDDASLAAYIQGGMCGSVPRPEISGNDLRDLIYYIRRSSLGGGSLAPVAPGPTIADAAAPVISNVSAAWVSATSVQVTWTTDKPALGFVAWGSRSDYNGWSPIETGYTTTHSVLMTGLPNVTTLHYAVVAKDIPGLQSNTADLTSTNPNAPPAGPPQIPINVHAVAGDGQITMTWDPVFQATAYNLYWTFTNGDPQTSGQKAAGVSSPFVLTNLTSGLPYFLTVTASNSLGEGAESAKVSATPTGSASGSPPPSTVTLPIELIGADNLVVSTTVFLINPSVIDHLWVRAHALDYADKGSLRINNGAWIPLDNNTVQVSDPGKSFGGIGGALSILEFTLPIHVGDLTSGTNTIGFRFNHTNGVSSGFRILGFNFYQGQTAVLPSNTFVWDDPAQWTAPMNGDPVNGNARFWTAQLVQSPLNPKVILASCRSCHANDGRDLQYFSFSNQSIIARAQFHGLSAQDGADIAAFIRTLSVAPSARPWDPPFQPGPGLDSLPVTQWSAGKGYSSVLAQDLATLQSLFPGGKVARPPLLTTATLNVRELPINLPLPDWNHWLPRTAPVDIVGSAFNVSNLSVIYQQLRTTLASQGAAPQTIAGIAATFQTWAMARKQLLSSQGAPSTPTAAENAYAIALWQLAKSWELMHEFNLENYGTTLFGSSTEARTWFIDAASAAAPDALGIPRGSQGLRGGGVVQVYLSLAWMQVQAILTPNRTGTLFLNWPTMWNEFRDLAAMTGIPNPIEFISFFTKAGQMTNNGIGPDQTTPQGWAPDVIYDLSRLVSPGFDPLWAQTASSVRTALLENIANIWLAQTQSYSRSQYLAGGHMQDGEMPVDNTPDGRWVDKMWYAIPRLTQLGVSNAQTTALIAWAKTLWPQADWDTLQTNPTVGASRPTLDVHVYPNPWRSDKHAGHPTITFDGLTVGTTIKIFTVSAHAVKELHTDGPKIAWDLTNDSGDKVASGIYLYVITDSQGDKVRGKLAVIK